MQYLIDASVYVFRAYYSMPDDMVDGEGTPVNALYGFARFIGDFMEQVKPQHMAVLWDESLSQSFRSEIYPEYKANREPAPPELKRQFEQCREYTRALGLAEFAHPKYEADDLIGTLVMHGREVGRPSTILTRDKDLAQLLDKNDVFWDFAGKGRITYQQIPDYFFGVWPEQIADFLALAGDSVDNIKGVPGVGQKTATALLQHFGSLDKVYSNIDKVHEVKVRGAKSLGAKLEMHKDAAMLARQLTGIACDAPLESGAGLNPGRPDLGAINALFDRANIGTALRRQAERVSDLH